MSVMGKQESVLDDFEYNDIDPTIMEVGTWYKKLNLKQNYSPRI